MKVKIVLGIVLTAVLFAGCKNEKEKDGEDKASGTPDATVVENFRVTLNVVAKKNDDFQVYFIENASEDFTEEKSQWTNFKGSENAQDVVINLPPQIVPSSLRIDLGLNAEQEDIKLNTITMEYYGKTFTVKASDIGKYFNLLEPTKVDLATGMVNAKDKDGKRVEPAIQAQESLNLEIAKLEK